MIIKIYPSEIQQLSEEVENCTITGLNDVFFRFREYGGFSAFTLEQAKNFVLKSEIAFANGQDHVIMDVVS